MERRIPGTAKVPDVTLKRGVVAPADEFVFRDAVEMGRVPAIMPEWRSPNESEPGMAGTFELALEPEVDVVAPADPSADGFEFG